MTLFLYITFESSFWLLLIGFSSILVKSFHKHWSNSKLFEDTRLSLKLPTHRLEYDIHLGRR